MRNQMSPGSMYSGARRQERPAPVQQTERPAAVELPLAMAYVPRQRWNTVYSLEQALAEGTLFPELNKPFCGRRCT